MLQAINDRAKGIIGWIIIGIISLTFALFGIADYLGDGPSPFAVKVDDSEVSIRDYQEALSRQRQRLDSMFAGKLPTDAAFENQMKQQVLNQLVTRILIENRARAAGYRVTDEMVSAEIKIIESFQQNGQFSSAMYEQAVNFQGMSVGQFENVFRSDMLVQQMQKALMQSSIIAGGDLQQVKKLQQQTREVSYIEFNNSQYMADISVTDEEVQRYYDQNSDSYMHPEQVSISYVELKADDIPSNIDVDEESIRRQYDEYVAFIADNEQRKAKHILVQFDADADDALATAAKNKINAALVELKSGASFDALAKKLSDDSGSASQGGDLGWISKGVMGEVFDAALFKLNKNEISDIVQTGFGYHLIKLVDIKTPAMDDYETRKAALIKDLKQQTIEKIFYDRSELMATLAYESDDTLMPVADALQLKMHQSELFTRATGSALAANSVVRNAAFDVSVLKEGRNSDVIELDRNHILVLRVDQHINAQPKNLDEVRAEIEMSLTFIKANEKAQEESFQALQDLQQGKSLKEVVKTQNVGLKRLGNIKRDNASADRIIVGEAFQMNKPAADKSVFKIVELRYGVAVIALHSVSETDAQVSVDGRQSDAMQALARDIEIGLSNQEMTAVIEFIKSQADITISKNL
jgi:peptidyl-prolyl cis-trans isomerase D